MKKEIKLMIECGQNFGNYRQNWYTSNRLHCNPSLFYVFIDNKIKTFNSALKATNAILKLLNTGSL